MSIFVPFLLPGEGFQEFFLLRKSDDTNKRGRTKTTDYQEKGATMAILTEASQREKTEWRQNEHPITHKIIQRWWEGHATAGDCLKKRADNERGYRFFYVQGQIDPGDLHHYIIYFCEEKENLP